MKPVDVQPINDINQAIGRAVTTLIAAGMPVEKYAILAELQESEAKAIDGVKKIYGEAIQFISVQMS